MIQKKICMLGAFAVGKTSLVAQFVQGIFSEKYLTTIGVKIDKKQLSVEGTELMLILWDLAGEDEFLQVRTSYLRGAAGYFLVIDGSRRASLEKAVELHGRAGAEYGDVPFIVLVNKADLRNEWDIEEAELAAMRSRGWQLIETSARTGAGVEAAFQALGRRILTSRTK